MQRSQCLLRHASRPGLHAAHMQPPSARRGARRPVAAAAKTETVTVSFKESKVSIEAAPGENILEVARRARAVINVGCCSNSCGICEVEVVKVDASGVAAAPVVVRSCIAGIPPGYAKIEIDEIVDTIWGVDGLDT